MEDKQELQPIKLEAELLPDGQLKLQCNALGNKIIMFGLLKMMELAIINHGTRIHVPEKHGIMDFVKGKRFS
jgi:hypothetical protein